MAYHPHHRLMELLDRVARLRAADVWLEDLNPPQRAALDYLSRANRFSRSPSHVAAYLSSTRGTVSQTLKALAGKHLVEEVRSASDKRRISYDLTETGKALVTSLQNQGAGLEGLSAGDVEALSSLLEKSLRSMLDARGKRSFGTCQTCRHHAARRGGAYCRLLKLDLLPAETSQICHEHVEAIA